jgi:integrase
VDPAAPARHAALRHAHRRGTTRSDQKRNYPQPVKHLKPLALRARLGYDRARILFTRHTGWQLHQLRHSAATHLGEQGIPLQLIMAKTRHRNPRTAMRYVRPGAKAVAEITALLEPPRRRG